MNALHIESERRLTTTENIFGDIPADKVSKIVVTNRGIKRREIADRLSIAMWLHTYRSAQCEVLGNSWVSTQACISDDGKHMYWQSAQVVMEASA